MNVTSPPAGRHAASPGRAAGGRSRPGPAGPAHRDQAPRVVPTSACTPSRPGPRPRRRPPLHWAWAGKVERCARDLPCRCGPAPRRNVGRWRVSPQVGSERGEGSVRRLVCRFGEHRARVDAGHPTSLDRPTPPAGVQHRMRTARRTPADEGPPVLRTHDAGTLRPSTSDRPSPSPGGWPGAATTAAWPSSTCATPPASVAGGRPRRPRGGARSARLRNEFCVQVVGEVGAAPGGQREPGAAHRRRSR